MSELKYKEGDKVRIKSLDWYNQMLAIKDKHAHRTASNGCEFIGVWCGNRIFKNDMTKFCGQVMTIKAIENEYYIMHEDTSGYWYCDEMIEGLVEEETPKFKVNDIVFVKNIGWVRITNSYWYSLANEYIYEAIGFDGTSEYDCISQSNIEGQMLPESENPHTGGNKITLDEYKNNDKEWLFNKLAMLSNIAALESIQDIFNHLQQPKYPKTYEECCKILGHLNVDLCFNADYRNFDASKEQWKRLGLMNQFYQLLICRDAYWKIAGEEMGLGKPWEPDYTNTGEKKFSVWVDFGEIKLGGPFTTTQMVLSFPTAEMRDAFYENFKELIENCKELL